MGEHSRPGRRERHALENDAPPWKWAVAKYGPVCGECGVRFDTPSPDCPHRLTNVHPLGAGTSVIPALEAPPAANPGAALEGVAFNPPRTCDVCGSPLEPGEGHLHFGLPAPADDQRLDREAFTDAVDAYNRAVTAAFADYRTNSEAAWRAYQASMTTAGAAYDTAVKAAGTAFDAVTRQAGPAAGADQPAGPYYPCCEHCEHGCDKQPDMHEIPCSEGCTPTVVDDVPHAEPAAYLA